MLQSLKEERARHFKLALRVGIPLLLFIFLLAYAIFFHGDRLALGTEAIVIFVGMVFVIVYFIFFALELSRKETLVDRVTGGYHYDAFVDRVVRERPRTLAALQIGNLAVVNETFGVRRADRLLRALVEALDRELLREFGPRAWIGRKNGAEFLLALEAEPEAVEAALERFVQAHPQLEELEVDLVFAVIRNNVDDPEQAIDQLRDLLVQRESCPPPPAERRQVSDAREISAAERRVIDALERGALSLSFRPLRNLHSGRPDIYEVGVKMRGEEGSVIAPREFLPIVNRHGLGERYDLLIVDRVLELARLSDESIALSFNLSPFSLRKEEFLAAFHQRLQASGVTPPRLIVELYERKSHHRPEEYFKRLKVLKRWGVRLCLDNFGSSNASMEYLRHFPFDLIQFDREYTFDLKDGKSLPMLRSFITMAHELRMLTGAKWVDTPEKVATLRELGVDYIQGFAAGRVLDEHAFVAQFNPLKEHA
jgi:EAL domain-containing protein (putative c-di-GMP-specific phosphodiesterase class I)/GGDEF domain-containing protein